MRGILPHVATWPFGHIRAVIHPRFYREETRNEESIRDASSGRRTRRLSPQRTGEDGADTVDFDCGGDVQGDQQPGAAGERVRDHWWNRSEERRVGKGCRSRWEPGRESE